MIILDELEQGSQEWHNARCGRITMSNAGLMLTGGKGTTRYSYLLNVASEILSGTPAETPTTWAMERGNLLEPFARQAYEAKTGETAQTIGLAYLNENKTVSASPDGLTSLFGSIEGGIEIKCRSPKEHLRVINAGIDKKAIPQIQGCMWLFNVEWWDYVAFCPEFAAKPLFISRVYRDEVMIKKLEESVNSGLEEIQEIINSVAGSEDSAVSEICDDALTMLDYLKNEEPEIF